MGILKCVRECVLGLQGEPGWMTSRSLGRLRLRLKVEAMQAIGLE